MFFFLITLLGMMTAMTVSQISNRPRLWIATGLACFVLCLSIGHDKINIDSFKIMLQSAWKHS